MYLGLPVGKLVGISGGVWLMIRFTKLSLEQSLSIKDVIPVSLVAGIGFTVSLLIAELSFPDGTHTAGAKIAILIATLLAAVAAAILLRWDARKARSEDMNEDGVADQDIARIGDEEF